jgi:hypothetical protein
MQTDTLVLTGNSRTNSPLLGEEVLTNPLVRPADWYNMNNGQGISYTGYANVDWWALGQHAVLLFDVVNTGTTTPTLHHMIAPMVGTRYEICIQPPFAYGNSGRDTSMLNKRLNISFGGVVQYVDLEHFFAPGLRYIVTATTEDPLFVPLSGFRSCTGLGISIRPILDVSQPLISGPLEIRADDSGNVAVGVNAGRYIKLGSGNVIIGTDAVADTDTCTDGVFLGRGANPSSTGSINEIVIGAGAVGHGSGTATIGNDTTETYLGIVHVNGMTIPDSSTGKLYRFTITDGILGTEEIL